MPRKSKLPVAADFFALTETTTQAGTVEQDSSSPGDTDAFPAPIDSTLMPPLVIPEGPTEKVTLYLHPQLLRRLELYKAQLLVEHNLKVNRSQIVDYLLEEGLRNSESLTQGLLSRAK